MNKLLSFFTRALFALTAIGIVVSCGQKEDPKVEVTGVSLNKTEVTLHIGESFQLVAHVSPYNATDKTVKWSSNAASVSVSDNGLVEAVSVGTGDVTATAGTISAKCAVTCIEWPKVESIAFGSKQYTVKMGGTTLLEFTYSPENAINSDFTWQVADPAIAKVDDKGKLEGLAPGKTTVTVSADNGVKDSAEIVVTIEGENEDYGYEDLN